MTGSGTVITDVILLKSSLFMKISIFNLFMVTTITGLGIALYVEHTSNQLLQSGLAAERDAVAESEAMVDYQRKLLGDARLGHALLCRMAVSKDQDEILEYVRTIPAELLSCVTKEMPEYSPVKLVWFHTNRQLPNGSISPIDKRKKAALLLNAESLEIIDYVFYEGFSSLSTGTVESPYVLNWDGPDGTKIRYNVLPTGFERQN